MCSELARVTILVFSEHESFFGLLREPLSQLRVPTSLCCSSGDKGRSLLLENFPETRHPHGWKDACGDLNGNDPNRCTGNGII